MFRLLSCYSNALQDEINVWSYESTAEDVWFYSAKDIEEGEELLLEYNIARK
jgi:SET domain-containing protein